MAVALHTQPSTHGNRSSRATVPTTYRSGGAGGRVSSVRSARDSGHLRIVAGNVAARRPAVTPAIYRRRRIVVAAIFAAVLGAVGSCNGG